MVDGLSPLDGHVEAGVYGARQDEPGVALAERRLASLVQVCAWPDTVDRIEAVVAAVTGCSMPTQPNGSSSADGHVVMSLGPGRYLIESDDPRLAQKFDEQIDADLGAITDLSHARIAIRVDGPRATWVLSKGLALDLDPRAFPPSGVAQSAIHEIGVIVRRLANDKFDLYVTRGFALSFLDWLTDAAAETGYRVTPSGSE